MRFLKNIGDVNAFWATVDKCAGEVILRSASGDEELNLKSVMSRYIAVAKLIEEHGDEYEIFCMNSADEHFFMEYFQQR